MLSLPIAEIITRISLLNWPEMKATNNGSCSKSNKKGNLQVAAQMQSMSPTTSTEPIVKMTRNKSYTLPY